MINVVVAGPCGVGKSTIAEYFARSTGMTYLDFDELRGMDVKEGKAISPSPCSVSMLNLKDCLPTKLEKISSSFILDIGGDTVFRRSANNKERLDQIFWLKASYSVKIILLLAEKDVLFQRFVATKDRNESEFDEPWIDWKDVGEPYWRQCADLIIDTTSLMADDTVMKMKKWLFN